MCSSLVVEYTPISRDRTTDLDRLGEVDDYFEGRHALILMAAGVSWRHRGFLQVQSIVVEQ